MQNSSNSTAIKLEKNNKQIAIIKSSLQNNKNICAIKYSTLIELCKNFYAFTQVEDFKIYYCNNKKSEIFDDIPKAPKNLKTVEWADIEGNQPIIFYFDNIVRKMYFKNENKCNKVASTSLLEGIFLNTYHDELKTDNRSFLTFGKFYEVKDGLLYIETCAKTEVEYEYEGYKTKIKKTSSNDILNLKDLVEIKVKKLYLEDLEDSEISKVCDTKFVYIDRGMKYSNSKIKQDISLSFKKSNFGLTINGQYIQIDSIDIIAKAFNLEQVEQVERSYHKDFLDCSIDQDFFDQGFLDYSIDNLVSNNDQDFFDQSFLDYSIGTIGSNNDMHSDDIEA